MDVLLIIFVVFWLLLAGWLYPLVKYTRMQLSYRGSSVTIGFFLWFLVILFTGWVGYLVHQVTLN